MSNPIDPVQVIGYTAGAAAWSFLGGATLRLAVRWIGGLEVPYGRAVVTVGLGAAVSALLSLLSGVPMSHAWAGRGAPLVDFGVLLATLVASWLSVLLRHSLPPRRAFGALLVSYSLNLGAAVLVLVTMSALVAVVGLLAGRH